MRILQSAYADIMKDVHSGFVFKDSGLIVSIEYPFIGASPDGNVQCECCPGIGLLEVKCPYCIHDGEPSSAPYIQDDGNLVKMHAYYYQVYTQLFVCSADYANFVVATFRESDGDVNFSVKWYSHEEVMPAQAAVASTVSETYVYCYCKEDKGGEMVGCDNDNCEIGQWFHLS